MYAVQKLHEELFICCELKQPQLIYPLLDNITSLMEKIADSFETGIIDLKIPFINAEILTISKILDIDVPNIVLKIDSIRCAEAVVQTELKLFKMIASHIGMSDPEYMFRVSKFMMKLLVNMKMSIKIQIMTYFNVLYGASRNVGHKELPNIINNLNFWSNLLRYEDLWIGIGDVYDFDEFFKQLKLYCKKVTRIQTEEKSFEESLVKTFSSMIQTAAKTCLNSNHDSWQICKIAKLGVTQLIKINNSTNGQAIHSDVLYELLEYVQMIPDLFGLFILPVMLELETNNHDLLISIQEKIKQLASKTKNISFTTTEKLEENLIEWSAICMFIYGSIDLLKSKMQRLHIEKQGCVKDVHNIEFPRIQKLESINPIVSEILISLVNLVLTSKIQASMEFMAVILLDFAFHAYSVGEVVNLPENLQLDLMYILLSPLCTKNQILNGKLPKTITEVILICNNHSTIL